MRKELGLPSLSLSLCGVVSSLRVWLVQGNSKKKRIWWVTGVSQSHVAFSLRQEQVLVQGERLRVFAVDGTRSP